MKYLLEKGFLHGECLTVTGKTLAENLAAVPGLAPGQDDRAAASQNPIKPTGHIQILHGNLRPDGAVAKITGKEGLQFTGPARVFDSEEDMLAALEQGRITPGRRGHHPLRRSQGRTRDAGNAHADFGHHGGGTGGGGGLADRRPVFRRFARVHRRAHHAGSPGRRTARPGARRRPDHHRRRAESARRGGLGRRAVPRRAGWTPPPYKANRGTLYKYIKNVRPASEGCVTDE